MAKVWVPAYIKADGTRVKGYWKSNSKVNDTGKKISSKRVFELEKKPTNRYRINVRGKIKEYEF